MGSSRRAQPDLPQPIIHHILSFLPNKESAKTSILSKAWLTAWRTRPKLEFEPDLYFPHKLKQILFWGHHRESLCEELRIFSQYVKTTLKRYRLQNITIDTMTFQTGGMSDPGWNPLVKKCAKFAVKNGVRNLKFRLPKCDLPLIVFRAESLVDLCIIDGNIMELSVGDIRCHGLKRLCLKWLAVDVKMFENIVASCPLIEVLEIWYIEGFDDFKVTKVNHLKELIVRLFESQRIEVEAPNLEMLTCNDKENEEDIVDGDMTPFYITLCCSQYQNLKSLLFNGVGISDMFFNNLAYKFPNLEDLLVRECQELKRIKISSKSLRRIHLMSNWRLVEAIFDVPGIVVFEYSTDRDIIPKFYFAATSSQWVSYICICWGYDIDLLWLFKLKELLAGLTQSEISLEIDFLWDVAFDFDEIRNNISFYQPYVVQELSLGIDCKFSLSKAQSVLDGLFWVCRPKIIKLLWFSTSNIYEAEKSYFEMLMFTKQDELHNLQQINFWQHDLKKVKVAVFDSAICQRGDGISFIQKRKKERQLEDLDWDNFWSVLRNNESMERMICFELEWGKVCQCCLRS